MESFESQESIPKEQAPFPGKRICQVKFRQAGKHFDYDARDLELKRNDPVIVEYDKSLYLGSIIRPPGLNNADSSKQLPKIIRIATSDDLARVPDLKVIESAAFKSALLLLRDRNIPAKIVATEMSFSLDRLTIYFASEERLDFRSMIRDLSNQYRARIDIRQIGARDAAKIIGGIGSCGRELCCSTWLVEFRPVSIKMAKDQNLALNPQKVSGNCGRLLCCLTYEQDTYKELRQGAPKIGKRVFTPKGEGRVRDINVLRGKVRVQLKDSFEEFDISQVKSMFNKQGEINQPNFNNDNDNDKDNDINNNNNGHNDEDDDES